MKLSALLLLALALPAVSTETATAKTLERHFQKSFDVVPGAVLELDHGDGNVTIQPWAENRIDITVDYRAKITGIFTTARDFQVDFEQVGNKVRVTGRPTGSSGLIVSSEVRYQYLIKAPAWTELRTTGQDGSLDIAGWRASLDITVDDGSLELKTIEAQAVSIQMQDGDAILEGITGSLNLHCDDGTVRILDSKIASGSIEIADGDLDIRHCEGDLRITMDDGGVTLSEVRSRRLDIRGEDGHARAQLLPVENPDLSITMDDGEIDLAIPGDLSAAFEALADDGSIRIDLVGADDVRKGPHSVRGTLGEGKGRILLETADGSIRLHQARTQ